jgi:hypothetical protein
MVGIGMANHTIHIEYYSGLVHTSKLMEILQNQIFVRQNNDFCS